MKQRLILVKKHEELTGGRWVTITKRGSSLHGRHIYISSNGTILAGKVPKIMHGKNLSELSAPHQDMKSTHEDLKTKDKAHLETVKETHAYLSTAKYKSETAQKTHKKVSEIADHYLKVHEAKNTIHSHMQQTHADLKDKSIAYLQQNVTDYATEVAKSKIPKERAFWYKKMEIAKHYIKKKQAEEHQKVKDSAPHQEKEGFHQEYADASKEHLEKAQSTTIKTIENPIGIDSIDDAQKKRLDIINHYLVAKGGTAKEPEVKREVPTEAPHTSKQPIHNTYSQKTPAELKGIIKEAKAKIADGTANSFDKKKIAVASYYLNGGQKPDDSAFGSKKKKESVNDLPAEAPHADKEGLHSAYADRTPEELQASIASNTEKLQVLKDKGDGDSILAERTQRRIEVAKYYLAGGKKPDFDAIKAAKEAKSSESNNEVVDGIVDYLLSGGQQHIPHPEMESDHKLASNMSIDQMKQLQDQGIQNLNSGKVSDTAKYKKQIEIIQHYLKQKDPTAQINPIPDKDPHIKAHTAMDDFSNPNHQVKTDEYEHAGKNVKDFDINPDNPNHVHQWHKKIDHNSFGMNADELKSKANQLSQLMYYGTKEWGGTGFDSTMAKMNSQQKLIDSLHTNDTFMKAASTLVHEPEAHTISEKRDVAKRAIRRLIDTWAGSSGGTNVLSVAVQLAAKEEFGLDKSYDKFDPSTTKSAQSNYLDDADMKAGLKTFVREQYNQTQKFFKEVGITHVPIIRGMSFGSHDPIGHIPLNTAVKAKMQLQPLSSFSSSSSTAENFTGTVTGGKGTYKVMTAAMIPVERIMGSVQTGYGCMNEQEFVVLGGGKELDDTVTYAWHKHDPKGFKHDDMFKFLADPKFNGSDNTVSGTLDASGGHEGHLPKLVSLADKASAKTVKQNATSHAKKIYKESTKNGKYYDNNKNAEHNLPLGSLHHHTTATDAIKSSKDFTSKAMAHFKAKGKHVSYLGLTDEQKSEYAGHVIQQAIEEHHNNPTGTKPEKKNYHVAYNNYNSSTGNYEVIHKEAVNPKPVENAHGLDLFAHKVHGGYKVSEGTTGVGFTQSYSTQKKAIQAAQYKVNNNSKDDIEAKLADKPKVPAHLLKKNDDQETHDEDDNPIIYPDQDLHNADWTKTSWDLPPYGSKEFNDWLESTGQTLEQFKQTPAYQHLSAKQKMKKSEDYPNEEYYPSDRYAYKTNAKNVHYIPINRIKTPYQTEKALDPYKVKINRGKIRRGEAMKPCVIGYDYDLHDGHHRLEAAKSMNHTHVPCEVGGRNTRRILAAKRRYSTVFKSIGFVDGKLLIKKATAPKGGAERWVTIRGTHVKINGQGEILQGPSHMQGKNLSSVLAEKSGPHLDHAHHHNNYAKAGNKYLDHHKADAIKRADEAKASGNKEKHRDQKARIAIIDHYKSLTDGSDWQSKKKTPFDTKAIVEARAKAKAQIPTYKRDYYHSAERKKLRQDIIDKLYGTGAKNKNRRIDLVIGPPAAGKSTALADPLAAEHGSLLIDSDMAKEMLPEFDGGAGGGLVQEESSVMIESFGGLLDRAMSNGDNIVLPLVGRDANKLLKMQKDLHAAGYEVHLHLNEVPKDESTKRAIDRFYSNGRFVDPDYVYNVVGDKPSDVYEQLKKQGGFHSYEKVSNDVEKGQKPKLIERIKAGEKGTYNGGGSGGSFNGKNVSGVPEAQKTMSKSMISKAGQFLISSFKK